MLGITRRAAVLGAAADGHPARLFRGGEPGFCLPSVAEALRSGALLKDAAANLAVVGDTIHSIYNATSEIEVAPSAVAFAGESYEVSPGVYRLLSTAGVYSEVFFTLPVSTYRVTFTVSSRVSGNPVMTNGINEIVIPASEGLFSRVTNHAGNIGLKRQAGSTDLIISNVRFFRQVAGVGAQQFTATKRPLLTHRVNLHTQTEDFSNAAWTKSGATIDATKYADINGELRAQKVTFANGNANAILTQTLPIQLGNILRRFWIRADSATTVRNRSRNNGSSSAAPVINVTTSWQLVELSVAASGTGVDIVGWQNNAAGDAAPIYLCEVDTRPVGLNPLLPKYQRVVTDADCDTGGFPPFLRFDGLDDCLVTPNIDFSACEAVTVIAGLRKAAGTTVAAVCEHGVVSSPGAFGLFAPVGSSNSGNHVYMQTRGGADGGWYYDIPAGSSSVFASVLVGSATTRAEKAPTYVLNGNSLSVRYAGGAADPIGSGPFQNAALNIGQRNASVYAFAGDLYSLTVIGRRLSNAEMLATSRWINEQMGRVY